MFFDRVSIPQQMLYNTTDSEDMSESDMVDWPELAHLYEVSKASYTTLTSRTLDIPNVVNPCHDIIEDLNEK